MSLATSDIDFLCEIVAKHSGNMIAQRQVTMLEQKLSQVAKTRGLTDVSGLVAELRRTRSPDLSNQIAEAVTVNETSFFRDGHPFTTLQSSILPELMEKRKASKSIRIWCAACSSGQEPYTLAMTCNECPGLDLFNVSILASDISEDMLAKSRSGSYSQMEVNRGLPAKKLVANFDRKGRNWQVKEHLRNMIEFKRLNLTDRWPTVGQFDIVFIRNVLIYFDQAMKQQILRNIAKKILPGGYLFIGSSETIIGLDLPYKRKEINGTVFYQPVNA